MMAGTSRNRLEPIGSGDPAAPCALSNIAISSDSGAVVSLSRYPYHSSQRASFSYVYLRLKPLFAILLLAVLLCGCATQRYITTRSIPFNPLASQLDLSSSKGPKASGRTIGLLRKYDLLPTYQADIRKCLSEVQKLSEVEPEAEIIYAISELAYILGVKSKRQGNEPDALDMFGVAVSHAYLYLFSPRLDAIRNPYDPRFRGACDLYNESLEETLRLVQNKGELKPGGSYRFQVGEKSHLVRSVVLGPWRSSDFDRFEFCSTFEVEGLPNPNVTYGLGVPLVAVRKRSDNATGDEKFYPNGLSFAVTALLRVVDEEASPHADSAHRHTCILEFHDPLTASDISMANRLVPLQVDLATPLAYFLNSPQFQEQSNSTLGFLYPNQSQNRRGIYMLEPFDKNRIPVLMVHGLMSSPVTWMPMFNDLRSFPELRKNYQFWFYQYPSGQPFWASADQLRSDLTDLRMQFDPEQQMPALDQMVLVGHSMGGLVSRMQTIQSGDEFWRILSEHPFQDLKADTAAKKQLEQMLFFEPNRSIQRVITIGTPHQGSNYANDYTRWLGRKFIELPTAMVDAGHALVRQNPDFFRDTDLLTTQTAIDSLSPSSPIFHAMERAPKAPWTKYHNIVGTIPKQGIYGRISAGSDGVVELASAKMKVAESEIVIEAEHQTIHRTPRAILEVRRILKEHLDSIRGETRYAARDGISESPNSTISSAPDVALSGTRKITTIKTEQDTKKHLPPAPSSGVTPTPSSLQR
jgi:pimeloyl-ACP methyl ester carboxylesterase